jgi:hypothetical protein
VQGFAPGLQNMRQPTLYRAVGLQWHAYKGTISLCVVTASMIEYSTLLYSCCQFAYDQLEGLGGNAATSCANEALSVSHLDVAVVAAQRRSPTT